MPAVKSTLVANIDWDVTTGVLTVSLTRPGTQPYRFAKVPESVYYEFLNAPSAGTYFNRNVKPRFSLIR